MEQGEHITWFTITTLAIDAMLRLGLSLRVIMRRRPVGVSLAWLCLILTLPYVGALVYLFVGELRLGRKREKQAKLLHKRYEDWLADLHSHEEVDWKQVGLECEPLARLAESAVGSPSLPGNEIELIGEWQEVFRRLIADIDAAHRTVHMVFYIWSDGGMADEVALALARASQRGVLCRVLVDGVGGRPLLRSKVVHTLRAAGVAVQAALPVNLLRMLLVRFDLRMHRKIVVIDGEIAYTGSLNLVDPRYFKKEAGVGQWVDAMVRVRGPVVEPLGVIFVENWELETDLGLDQLVATDNLRRLPCIGHAAAQALPSGPGIRVEAIQQILLMTIYAARRELVLTTPYFVPDEAMITALTSAARRGVRVVLIVPAKVDSLLVRFASQAFKGDLADAGVEVMLFEGGLLHTKSVTVDGEFSLFGSLNLDPRSLFLNFEITLAIYDNDFTARLRRLQQEYIELSRPMNVESWRNRSFMRRLLENTARLMGPLL